MIQMGVFREPGGERFHFTGQVIALRNIRQKEVWRAGS